MKKIILIFLCFSFIPHLFAEESLVSIYDEFDNGLFGKSVHRGVIVTIKKSAFSRSETLMVKNEGEVGYLTAVVMTNSTAKKLMDGFYKLDHFVSDGYTIYIINKDGLNFSFSIEKAGENLIDFVSESYKDDKLWHDPLVEYYRDNYVLRIHSAENIFESWTEEITYNEAIVAATLIGDADQWLWGIHDGCDILNKDF